MPRDWLVGSCFEPSQPHRAISGPSALRLNLKQRIQKAAGLLKTREGLSHRKDFTHKLNKVYTACALPLQEKMLVNNRTLKACAALAPSVRRTSTSQQDLQVLAKARLVDKADEEQCTREVAKYTTSPRTATAAPGTPVDAFRAQTDMRE